MRRLQNPVKSALRSALQPNRFTYVKGNWIRECQELIQLVNLQKFEFGNRYFVNVSIFIRALDVAPELKEWNAPYRFRFDDRVAASVDRLLDFEDHDKALVPGEAGGPCRLVEVHDYNVVATDEEREIRLREIFEQSLVLLLDQLTTVDQLRDAYLTQKIRHVFIVREASLFLFGTEIMPLSRGGYLYKADNDDLRDRERGGGK